MESLYGQFSVHTLCEALEVPRGTFYNHIFRNKQSDTLAAKRLEQLKVQIQNIYNDSEQIHGAEKIAAILHTKGIKASEKYVSEIMKEIGISSVGITAKQDYKKWEKEGTEIFTSTISYRPNQVWVSDIITFKFSDKYYYLCAIIDLFSRKIISYRISQSSSMQLLTKTFRQAYSERKPETELMFHSDRGTQYIPYTFVRLL